ncbi:MAG: hypothetical protein ACRESZ_16930 [Methylococcales bacterium]
MTNLRFALHLSSRTFLLIFPLLTLAGAYPSAIAGPAKDEGPKNFWKSSCFVYRDINRNGVYDMGDRPYGDLPFKMTRPDGSVTRETSNIDGFTNFEMVLNAPGKTDIYEPGTYKVRAMVPPDWEITASDVGNQDLVFVARANAGSGMVPLRACNHVGVAPQLIVSGVLSAGQGSARGDITVSAQTGNEPPIDVLFDDAGNFRFPAKAGIWKITVADKKTGKSAVRSVTVDAYNVIVSMISTEIPQPAAGNGELVTVNFDDLLTADSLLEIPSGYNGLNWKYWISTHNRFYEGGGYVNATLSGEFIAYNSSGLPATVSRDTPFDFVGTYITAAWPRGEAEYVTVKAWRGQELAYQDVFLASNAGPSYFAADYAKVDRVEFSHGNYERVAIDNLTVRE